MLTEIIISFLVFCVVIGAIIFSVMINKREMKLDVKPNSSLFFNIARADFTNGYVLGIIKEQVKCKNDTTRITFFPVDRREGEGTKRPMPQTVIYHNSNLRRVPTGELSGEREIILGISSNPAELPRGLIKSSLGQFLEGESLLSFYDNRFGKRIKESFSVASDIITQDTSLGLTSHQLSRLKELMKEVEKTLPATALRQEEKTIK